MKTIDYRYHTITIKPDEYPESPRKWDNLGTMALFHRNYTLGDTDHGLSIEDCQSIEHSDQYISLPIYGYDHGGLTISTQPFSCPWDSGKLGIIYVDKETIRKEYSVKRVSNKLVAKIIDLLRCEVIEYNQYLTGDVWCYTIYKADGENIDNLSGLYGADYAIEVAEEWIDYDMDRLPQQLDLFSA